MLREDNILDSVIDNVDENRYDTQVEPGTEGENASADAKAAMRPDKLLTVQETCELLKVPKTYIYWLTHQKRIPYIKMQGHLRFRQSAIDDWLRSQEVCDASV